MAFPKCSGILPCNVLAVQLLLPWLLNVFPYPLKVDIEFLRGMKTYNTFQLTVKVYLHIKQLCYILLSIA